MILLRIIIFLFYFCAVDSSGISSENNAPKEKGLEILFLGLSGSGKSSTINMLLGRKVTEVRKKTNELIPTKTVIEYTLSESNDEEEEPDEINDKEHNFVRFIDTPGIGSTTGVLHEARIVSTLQKYLLEKRRVPPVVLIFSKFDDNRVEGDKSNFMKMLKKYNELLDGVYTDIQPQIIFVFTHYLGVTKREQRNPKPRLSMFFDIIRNFTTFPNSMKVTIAENEAEDEELDFDEDTGSYILPNKELYPQNLIDKILDAVDNWSTTSELQSYKRIFENRRTLNIDTKNAQRIVSADQISSSVIENDLKDKLQLLNLQISHETTTKQLLFENVTATENSLNNNFITESTENENTTEINENMPENSLNETFSLAGNSQSESETTKNLKGEVLMENEVSTTENLENKDLSIENLENKGMTAENFENELLTTENYEDKVLTTENPEDKILTTDKSKNKILTTENLENENFENRATENSLVEREIDNGFVEISTTETPFPSTISSASETNANIFIETEVIESTTQNPSLSTSEPDVELSSTFKTQPLSSGTLNFRNPENFPTEIEDDAFNFQIAEIKGVILTLQNRCQMNLPELKELSLSEISSLPVLKNMARLIIAIKSSGIFCRNEYFYTSNLLKLKSDIRQRRLSREKLLKVYREMTYYFPMSPNNFTCYKLKNMQSTSEYLGSHVGYGFNIQYGLPIVETPFKSVEENIECDRAFDTNNPSNQVTYTYQVLRNNFAYNKYFGQELENLSSNEPSYVSIQFFGILPSGLNPYYYHKSYYEWLEEYTTFSARMSEENLEFSQAFKDRVASLSRLRTNWAKGNCLTRSVAIDWKSFFNKYGTHIVVFAKAGGALKIRPNLSMWNKYFVFLENRSENEKARILKGIDKDKLRFSAVGGNVLDLYKNGLRNDSIDAWTKSLREKPALLESDLKLIPIVKYIKLLRPDLTETAEAVMTSLYAGGLRTYCNCFDCRNSNSICYTERQGNFKQDFLGMCFRPSHYQCSIRFAGQRLEKCP